MTSHDRPQITLVDFENSRIDPAAFDHNAHVYAVWLYMQAFNATEASQRFDDALRRLLQKLGESDKYHATITWFFLYLIAERYRENESWREFSRRNDDLTSRRQVLLTSHYSQQRLSSVLARQQFLLPDIAESHV